MATIQIADKPTLDEVNTKIGNVNTKMDTSIGTTTDTGGSATAGTVMGKLNSVFTNSEWVYVPGDVLLLDTKNAEIRSQGLTEVFYPKKIFLPLGGEVVVKFSSRRSASGESYVNIYVNGTKVSSVASASTEYTEQAVNVKVNKGDYITISASHTHEDRYTYIQYQSIKLYAGFMPKTATEVTEENM